MPDTMTLEEAKQLISAKGCEVVLQEKPPEFLENIVVGLNKLVAKRGQALSCGESELAKDTVTLVKLGFAAKDIFEHLIDRLIETAANERDEPPHKAHNRGQDLASSSKSSPASTASSAGLTVCPSILLAPARAPDSPGPFSLGEAAVAGRKRAAEVAFGLDDSEGMRLLDPGIFDISTPSP